MANNSTNTNPTDTLRQDAVKSTGWGFLDKGLSFLVQVIVGIVLARLLPPSDFGLIGLGMIIIGFGQIFVNLGLGPSLIQKTPITERHVRVVLTTSVLAGAILALGVYLGAPLAGMILDSQRVVPIIKLLSVLFILSGFQIPSYALLKKELHFNQIFFVSLFENILYGLTAILLAWAGYGVWSLVIGKMVQKVVSIAGSYAYTRHSLRPLMAKKEFLDLAHFGSGETLSGIFNYVALQGDYFLVGRLLGAQALGLYTKSYMLMEQPTTQFVGVLSNILFPAATKIKHDAERFSLVFIRTMEIIAFFTIPMCATLVIAAPDLVIGLYGENWSGAILPLQILGGFGVFRALYNASASFLKARGWVYPIFYAQVVYGIIMLGGVWAGATSAGLAGAAWAVGGSIFIMWLIMMELNVRASNCSRAEVLGTLVPGMVVGAIVIITLLLTRWLLSYLGFTSAVVDFVLLSIAGVGALLASIVIVPQHWMHHIGVVLLDMMEESAPERLGAYCQKARKWISD